MSGICESREFLSRRSINANTPWSKEESDLLGNVVRDHLRSGWTEITRIFLERCPFGHHTRIECMHHWFSVLNPTVNKSIFSVSEFLAIFDYFSVSYDSTLVQAEMQVASRLKLGGGKPWKTISIILGRENINRICVRNAYKSLMSFWRKPENQAKTLQNIIESWVCEKYEREVSFASLPEEEPDFFDDRILPEPSPPDLEWDMGDVFCSVIRATESMAELNEATVKKEDSYLYCSP